MGCMIMECGLLYTTNGIGKQELHIKMQIMAFHNNKL